VEEGRAGDAVVSLEIAVVIPRSGTVMLAALPVLIGVQLLLAFLSDDMQSQPHAPLHRRL
jgi:hypothetical protein